MKTSRMITTGQLASRFQVMSGTIRRNLCVKGHYLGIVPVKLPNGRLMWSEDRANEVLGQTAKGHA